MTLNEYQTLAARTRKEWMPLVYPTLGLAGETGEFADKVKKHLRGDYELNDEKRHLLALELGDVLWYLAACASDIGYTLDDVASMNIFKLASRDERGVIQGSGDER